MFELVGVVLASLLAGLVDGVVGGGGLISVPALFGFYPQANPATLLGTNKAANVWGTAFAAWRYAQRVSLRWSSLGPAAMAGLLGSLLGAWVVTQIHPQGLRTALPLILLAVLIYTILKKDMGRHHTPHHSPYQERVWASALGLGLGFYDGFFGPGTGSFIVFLWVRLLGYDFVNASASAKVINTATNFAAMLLFAYKGHVWWHVAAAMAVANIAGNVAGTYLALKHGAGFVRIMFIVVVSLLICKTGWDAWRVA